MNWLFLALVAYIILSDAELAELTEAETMRNKPRRTRRYDDDVCEIVVKDSAGHHYYFIFDSASMMDVLDAALKFAKNGEFGFDRADALTVASDLELCLMMKGGAF